MMIQQVMKLFLDIIVQKETTNAMMLAKLNLRGLEIKLYRNEDTKVVSLCIKPSIALILKF